jgi:hypothetical protein
MRGRTSNRSNSETAVSLVATIRVCIYSLRRRKRAVKTVILNGVDKLVQEASKFPYDYVQLIV